MNAKVIFTKTIQNELQVSNYLDKLIERTDVEELAVLVFQGFVDLEEAPLSEYPLGKTEEPYLVDRIINGKKVQIELVKKLSEPKIFEMRVDFRDEFHRFIYFPYIYEDEPLYVLVYGFEKVLGKHDKTNYYMMQAKSLYDYFRRTGRENNFFEEWNYE